jgi:aminoglycoside phosphotransferase family enzyme/predicted kinase
LRRLTGSTVELRETHISWVFLVGDRAYKLKKPLVLPFVDYGTPARRRALCREEVRLNRRLAPDAYLGVRAVVEGRDGLELRDQRHKGAVDYVVEMRRYDEQHTLAARLARGELRRQDLEAVAHRIQAFHASCPQWRGRLRGSTAIRREVEQNLAQLLDLCGSGWERDRIGSLGAVLTGFVATRAEELDRRRTGGLIRECHGDLRAEHVVLEGDAVTIVDCVEFDRALRTLDVADDLAFLMMDLAAIGGERYGEQLIVAYRRAGGDCGDDALMSFYAIHRTLVRVKVLLVRATQTHTRAHARELLQLAERYRWRALGPLVVVVCGRPASGKSTLASALAARSDLAHLNSDHIRKRLAHIEPTARGRSQHYGTAFNRATYEELGREAAAEVHAGRGAIVDATFRHRTDRAAFANAFGDAAPLLFVECRAPRAELLRRARGRERTAGRVSDATVEVVKRARWESLSEVPGESRIVVRTDRPVERLVAEVTEALSRWFFTADPAG